MDVREKIALKPYTTFKMGGKAAYFCALSSTEEVAAFAEFAEGKKLPLIVIGGGSNIIFPDAGEIFACVGKMEIGGFEIVREDETEAVLMVGAGEEWDSVVEKTVAMNLSGIEALSAIPGSAGATPVQNVGAYGQEIADVFVSLNAYDRAKKEIIEMKKEDCQFSYRDSIFKKEGKDRYIILSITLKLSKKSPHTPDYPGVKTYLRSKQIEHPTLKEIREAIIDIRKVKLPNPKIIASCGSFFKNPIVKKEEADRIAAAYPNAVIFPVSGGAYKIGAGWMIDTLGLKGRRFGDIEVYPKNALVLTNVGHATREDLAQAVEYIQKEVKAAFGVDIEPEPVWIA
jgi:UDP-N-acetylmuramate dehydrogenase